MGPFKSDFLRALSERGYIHQITDAAGLDARAQAGVISAYIGFDATADSLHIGKLVQIMLVRRLQQAGHRPIALMGGGTTKVGDPSGRDETRQLLTEEQINANITGIRATFARFLDFTAGPSGAIMANNDDWLKDLQYIDFLRDVGRHFTINRMLTMDSVKLRLEREQPLTFLEFNYMIMQGYDFVELFKRYGCTLKMGKTASGAVWLNPNRLSPYDYWQFWRNTEDGDVGRFLRMFTDLPLAEVARLEQLAGAEINVAKEILATEATQLCHGDALGREAAATAARAFAGDAVEGLPTIVLKPGQNASVIDVTIALG